MLGAGVGEERTSAFVLLSFKESSLYIEETELNQTLVLEERCFILLCTEPTGFGWKIPDLKIEACLRMFYVLLK